MTAKYQVWIHVRKIENGTDEPYDLGFAESATFEDEDQAAEFAHYLHTVAELTMRLQKAVPK